MIIEQIKIALSILTITANIITVVIAIANYKRLCKRIEHFENDNKTIIDNDKLNRFMKNTPIDTILKFDRGEK